MLQWPAIRLAILLVSLMSPNQPPPQQLIPKPLVCRRRQAPKAERPPPTPIGRTRQRV
jgi:hypothetical protein